MALRKARAAVASSTEIEAAAEEILRKGNALDAVVAGVFAAAALSPGVLLGPVQILIGGAGAGFLAIDGRVRQPGIGAPRPRGFVNDDEVPDAARVGTPWLPATLSVAIATAGTSTFAQVLAPAIALAKGSAREEILRKIASRGPRAIEERPLSTELFALTGRAAGGLLTPEDLASVRPEVQKATRFEVARDDAPTSKRDSKRSIAVDRPTRTVVVLPWAHVEDGAPTPPAHGGEAGPVRAVAAVDHNATFAVACWEESTDGIAVGDLGLRAPFFAEPVRRGQTRVRPGDARPAAGPVALVGSPAAPDVAFAAFGAGDAYAVLRAAIRGMAFDGRIEAHGEARLVALTHAQGTAAAFRS